MQVQLLLIYASKLRWDLGFCLGKKNVFVLVEEVIENCLINITMCKELKGAGPSSFIVNMLIKVYMSLYLKNCERFLRYYYCCLLL